MKLDSWLYGFASVMGTSHKKTNKPCQDVCTCNAFQTADGENVLIAVVSDGAGSAYLADVGASMVCSSVMNYFGQLVKANSSQEITEIFLYSAMDKWLLNVQKLISVRAEEEGHTVRDYAATVLCGIVGAGWAAFFQVGDGAIVVSNNEYIADEIQDKYNWVFWPQKGEYENTTYFVTSSEAIDIMQKGYCQGIIRELAIFSDGIQNLTLNYNSQTVHSRFFGPIFDQLRESVGSIDISKNIEVFLNSEKVNLKTDDDKSLILALR
ncbi:MAG: protein phosphatase protein [Firmicutes bacterium]|nr:protein phosphatase protein [Bacillota bacterium]